MNVGIEKIAFHVPSFFVDMTDLAIAREVDPGKFLVGIGQDEMAVIPASQDIVTLGANAAAKILTEADKQKIDMVIVGTESAFDYSKSAAVIIQKLLGIQPFVRAYEIKQACYGATAALQQAKEYVKSHPERSVLVIAADISKYGLNSGGEVTQGAGAVAMLITANPSIAILSEEAVFYSEDIYDFWRPEGHDYPLVDGHLSNDVYINSFQTVWQQNKKQFKRSSQDYAALAFHLPYTKMGRKALQSIFPELTETEQQRLTACYDESIVYSKKIGNLYTGSLYLGLVSLLENSQTLQAGDLIGLFSYGSGAVSEFFSLTLVAGYQEHLQSQQHEALLAQRQQLTIPEYEAIFNEKLPRDDSELITNDSSPYAVHKVAGGIRYYNHG
ncbi:hydroxymethylglutaryl-CoA synthase [Enterococcus sp. PF1-24]|uniref:hydroxymethylglutaryl-CoA synthase n=1 Tax=unclassified Enterococcus TaxID=2608891 RepID=UPI002476F9E3|nr:MULTISPECIES: hydroxymethylglutaryl-CoA synthase [unclassified Enterococcus]MDH6363790.1 hydroxymethylglutaryl-CoA synthase [Enterococcus sp. PFB1-1]MDH6400746.1 hydroxymethylglutaryl-CoA synthase [Enterococcus sp. PF1-24]